MNWYREHYKTTVATAIGEVGINYCNHCGFIMSQEKDFHYCSKCSTRMNYFCRSELLLGIGERLVLDEPSTEKAVYIDDTKDVYEEDYSRFDTVMLP